MIFSFPHVGDKLLYTNQGESMWSTCMTVTPRLASVKGNVIPGSVYSRSNPSCSGTIVSSDLLPLFPINRLLTEKSILHKGANSFMLSSSPFTNMGIHRSKTSVASVLAHTVEFAFCSVSCFTGFVQFVVRAAVFFRWAVDAQVKDGLHSSLAIQLRAGLPSMNKNFGTKSITLFGKSIFPRLIFVSERKKESLFRVFLGFTLVPMRL